jgi:hypothetical protein
MNMLRTLATVIILASSLAGADEVSLSNLGRWRLVAISQKSALTGNAHMILTLPGRGGNIPTVFVEAIKDELHTSSIEEWRAALNVPKDTKDSLYKGRYTAEFQRDVGGDRPMHFLLMAEAVAGRVHVFSYQNLPKTFEVNVATVRQLLKRIKLTDTRGRRI